MMKYCSILWLVSLLFSCSFKKSKENGNNTFVPEIYLQKTDKNISIKNDTVLFNGKKYSGYLFELFSTAIDTFSIQGYIDGLHNGAGKKWFLNRQLMEKRLYSNGKKNGLQIAFWENGNKKFEFIAKDDAYEGELKEWDAKGMLTHLANYVNGQEEGIQKMWYENGKIKANYVIYKGRRYGLLGTKNCKNVSDSIFAVK